MTGTLRVPADQTIISGVGKMATTAFGIDRSSTCQLTGWWSPRKSPSPPRKGELTMVCFSCGQPGHGVSRCPRIDAAFPFLSPGWSVEHRDGQYRVVWPKGTPGRRFQPGNDDWSGRGSTSRISNSSRPTDPGGGSQAAFKQTSNVSLPPVDSRHQWWIPDEPSYPPLSRQQADRPTRLTDEHPNNRRTTTPTDVRPKTRPTDRETPEELKNCATHWGMPGEPTNQPVNVPRPGGPPDRPVIVCRTAQPTRHQSSRWK